MILRSLLVATGLCAAYAAALLLLPAHLVRRGATTHQANCIRAENIVHAARPPENLIVGSSLFDMVPPEMLGPEFGSLALAGGSARTGIEIVHRSGLRPRRLWVEANFLTKAPDPELLGYLYDFPLAGLRRQLPILRQSHQPIHVLYSLMKSRQPPAEIVGHARQLETALRHHRAAMATAIPGPDLARALESVRERLTAIQASGVEVILVELPVHPELAQSPGAVALRTAVADAFPADRFRWVRAAAGETYETTDGLHLVSAGARRFAAQIRLAAGLPPKPAAGSGAPRI